MNESKLKERRFWCRWANAGAVEHPLAVHRFDSCTERCVVCGVERREVVGQMIVRSLRRGGMHVSLVVVPPRVEAVEVALQRVEVVDGPAEADLGGGWTLHRSAVASGAPMPPFDWTGVPECVLQAALDREAPCYFETTVGRVLALPTARKRVACTPQAVMGSWAGRWPDDGEWSVNGAPVSVHAHGGVYVGGGTWLVLPGGGGKTEDWMFFPPYDSGLRAEVVDPEWLRELFQAGLLPCGRNQAWGNTFPHALALP